MFLCITGSTKQSICPRTTASPSNRNLTQKAPASPRFRRCRAENLITCGPLLVSIVISILILIASLGLSATQNYLYTDYFNDTVYSTYSFTRKIAQAAAVDSGGQT